MIVFYKVISVIPTSCFINCYSVTNISSHTASGQVVLTWHLQLLADCLVQQVSIQLVYYIRIYVTSLRYVQITSLEFQHFHSESSLQFMFLFYIAHCRFSLFLLITKTENNCCVVVCWCGSLFVFLFITWVRRQCWATCPTVLPMGVSTVDFVFNEEPMHRLAGSWSPSTDICCYMVDLQLFPQHLQ